MLEKINTPEDVKNLNLQEKKQLAEDIRKYILEVVSQNGGHLASNLGVVELTIALHSVFNEPVDKIVWDVGHQTYVHKILTGRKEELKNIRKLGGIAGFPKTKESAYDCFNTGHSSTSISAALGMARARDLKGENNSVVAVIGDGALTGGMAIEALNDVGFSKCKMTVILNDNEMSISPNIGGLNMFLSKLRTKKLYTKSNISGKKIIGKIPVFGKPIVKIVQRLKRSVKQLIIPKMFFEDIGFTYLGPVDGHNIEQLENILKLSKQVDTPVLIHVLTKKGKGYKIAEENPDKFHATGPFDLKTGKPKKAKGLDYSKVFGNKLVEMAEKNDKIVAITASMKDGTGLTKFQKQFPKRFFDIGIAEQHAVTLAAGMATQGLIPFVPIYSSFYQRAYDQVIHDIAIQNLHVILCVDRAGIVGADGETHQGLLDMAFFRLVPNLIIMAPKDFKELEDMLEFAVKIEKPVVIRYPRGGEDKDINFETHNKIEFGKAEVLKEFNKDISSDEKNKNEQCIDEKNNQNIKNQIVNKGQECAQKNVLIIAIGKMVARAMKIAEQEEKKGNNVCVVNSRFLKPLDRNKILQLLKESNEVITIEDGTIINGLGTAIKEIIAEENLANIEIKTQAYPDDFIQHGSVEQLESMYLGGIHG
ncbi:MAG: 1-deoxy-D-xylulose-5-phosphate synthase [Clostridium sp. 27_14]|nr:MAG: 1-deoxy-D-xylulose-5-phosphate synthase [Clostridium sp. 27_14]